MKKNINSKLILIILLCLTIFSHYSFAQDKDQNRTIGLSALWQDSQLDFLFPFWVSKTLVLTPALSVQYVEDAGTDLGLGFGFKYYLSARKVSPYLGARFGALLMSPEGGDSTTDLIIGLLYGGEYFFSSNFSVSIEAQANLVKSDEDSHRFGNPGGINVNTATAIIANIYF